MIIEALVSSPEYKDYLQKQGISRCHHFENLDQIKQIIQSESSRYFLVLNSASDIDFDYHYFINHSLNENCSLLTYSRNDGRELFYPNENMMIKEARPASDQYDGYTESGIYYLSKESLLDLTSWEKLTCNKGVPCPRVEYPTTKPALFLDRDGVIIEDGHYLFRPEEINIYPDIIPLIKKANEEGWYVFVLTNQSGVARGYFSEHDVKNLHVYLDQKIQEAGAYINHWYTFPFHISGDGDFKRKSLLRKPQPGMLLAACHKQSVNLNESFMIGDKKSDILNQPGVRTLLIQRSYPLDDAQAPLFFDLKTISEYLFK